MPWHELSPAQHALSLARASLLPPLASPALAQGSAPARTLRSVPQANLSILDPVFTAAAVSITHGYCVFDTLYGVDGRMRPQPHPGRQRRVAPCP